MMTVLKQSGEKTQMGSADLQMGQSAQHRNHLSPQPEHLTSLSRWPVRWLRSVESSLEMTALLLCPHLVRY